uniref:Uncharacterized protein n=1 Tax=Timema poppense TaxID=170557 RepID=A0A7R9CH10_TIMPO|nr:unnamed protein product [Timema poppensis]
MPFREVGTDVGEKHIVKIEHEVLRPLDLYSASQKPILWDGGWEGERCGVTLQPTKISFRANKNRWITETVAGASYQTVLANPGAGSICVHPARASLPGIIQYSLVSNQAITSYFSAPSSLLILFPPTPTPPPYVIRESDIPMVGNVFSFVFTKYPPEWRWSLIKAMFLDRSAKANINGGLPAGPDVAAGDVVWDDPGKANTNGGLPAGPDVAAGDVVWDDPGKANTNGGLPAGPDVAAGDVVWDDPGKANTNGGLPAGPDVAAGDVVWDDPGKANTNGGLPAGPDVAAGDVVWDDPGKANTNGGLPAGPDVAAGDVVWDDPGKANTNGGLPAGPDVAAGDVVWDDPGKANPNGGLPAGPDVAAGDVVWDDPGKANPNGGLPAGPDVAAGDVVWDDPGKATHPRLLVREATQTQDVQRRPELVEKAKTLDNNNKIEWAVAKRQRTVTSRLAESIFLTSVEQTERNTKSIYFNILVTVMDEFTLRFSESQDMMEATRALQKG